MSPSSVLDVGCGVGSWLKAWLEVYPDIEIAGIDGPYIMKKDLVIDHKRFQKYDLKFPFNLNRTFDLVTSFEVAEHLPETSADSFVRSLTEHGSIIAFSASIPYQDGTHHINEQYPEYWAQKFMKYGFHAVDIIREKIWDNEQIPYWYKQNILIFINSAALEKYPILQQQAIQTNPAFLTRIHPDKWERKNKHLQHISKSVFNFVRWKYLSRVKMFVIKLVRSRI
ncbi:class I SAM-dependent methyltransferase [Niabella ginsengisoli]|uniref:Class I SAM-dependent methyltransferase n=1 Tax=Niabella ginsengisoli TaxID=522298 RepID=A0ABS9SLR0_9BACT|nr:class I SAM-dependent methyltransferase [Niabella ginsengisoli]